MKTLHAKSIGSVTLVGYPNGPFPMSSGNCFDVRADDGKYYKIVNFGYENLKELLRLGLTWPIQIEVIEGHCAVLNDSRIGDRWYSSRFCEVCTPRSLLPIPQRLAQLRCVARGQRQEDESGWVKFQLGDIAHEPQFP